MRGLRPINQGQEGGEEREEERGRRERVSRQQE
jgi:hypothetical protein